MVKISVIIPVYNSEKYLKECIDSILAQTYKNYEIIIINDGSTDNSKYICEQYEKSHNNVKLYSIENHGVSYARNLGISKANGEFIYFMDSDDILFSKCFEIFDKLKIDNNSLYCFKWMDYYKNTIPEFNSNYDVEKFTNTKELILLDDNISSFLWNKIYQKNILIDNNLRFDENIHYCEDKIFNLQYVKYVNTIIYNPNLFYLYRVRKNSVTGKYISEKNLSVFNVCEYIINNSKNKKIEDYYKWLYIVNYKKFKVKFPFFKYNTKILNDRKKLYLSKNLTIKLKIKLFIIYNLFFLLKYKKNRINGNSFE